MSTFDRMTEAHKPGKSILSMWLRACPHPPLLLPDVRGVVISMSPMRKQELLLPFDRAPSRAQRLRRQYDTVRVRNL